MKKLIIRNLFIGKWPKAFKGLLWFLAALLFSASLFISILAIRLSSGPISLDFAISYIEKNLQVSNGPYNLNVKNAYLSWNKETRKLAVQAKDISLVEKKNGINKINIPNLELSFRILPLFSGQFIPSRVTIIKPHLKLYQDEDGNFSFSKEENIENPNAGSPTSVPLEDYQTYFTSLKSLRIKDLDIDVENLKTGKKWQIPSANVIVSRRKGDIECNISLAVQKATATANIKATLIKNGTRLEAINVSISGVVGDIPFNEIDKFWHPNIAPVPREWVLKNLSDAMVPEASINLQMFIDLKGEKPNVKIEKVNGQIAAKGMTVQFLDSMPKIYDVDGLVHYDKENFKINITKGHLKGLNLKEGSEILITHMDEKDQDIFIDLLVEGPLKTALELLNNDPVNIHEEFTLNINEIEGIGEAKIHFDFPLERTVELNQVNATAQAHLKEVQIANVMGKDSQVTLKEGDLHLEADRKKMSVKGVANCRGVPLSIHWKQRFKDVKEWRAQYDIQAKVKNNHLKSFGVHSIVNGPIDLSIQATENKKNHILIQATADLKQADFVFPLVKGLNKPGEDATISVEAFIKQGKLHTIKNLSLKGKKLNAEAQVSVEPKTGQVKELSVQNFKLGENNFSLKVRQNKAGMYYVDVKGAVLDVRPLLQSYSNGDVSTDWEHPFYLTLAVNKVLLENNGIMNNARLSCQANKNGIQQLHTTASIVGTEKGQTGQFAAVFETRGSKKTLHIDSNKAGLFLSLLGFTKTVRDGTLYVDATQQGEAPWKGKLELKNIYVTEAPVVTQILSMASPLGLIDAFTGRAITFDKLRTMFKYDNNMLTLRHGRAAGKSIGFTFSGAMDLFKKTIDLKGTIMPYNAFNMLLTKIPIVGTLLGGKGGGIFGINYHLKGPRDSPTSSVNPLSVFTPGILRKIFASNDENDFEDEEDNKNYK